MISAFSLFFLLRELMCNWFFREREGYMLVGFVSEALD